MHPETLHFDVVFWKQGDSLPTTRTYDGKEAARTEYDFQVKQAYYDTIEIWQYCINTPDNRALVARFPR